MNGAHHVEGRLATEREGRGQMIRNHWRADY